MRGLKHSAQDHGTWKTLWVATNDTRRKARMSAAGMWDLAGIFHASIPMWKKTCPMPSREVKSCIALYTRVVRWYWFTTLMSTCTNDNVDDDDNDGDKIEERNEIMERIWS